MTVCPNSPTTPVEPETAFPLQQIEQPIPLESSTQIKLSTPFAVSNPGTETEKEILIAHNTDTGGLISG